MSAVLQAHELIAEAVCNSLSYLGKGESARIVSVDGAHLPAELLRRLADLGFVPGEWVRVLARGPLGGEPVAVRVGTSTFALRRIEADCIRVDARLE